jgi:hypothetical protein
MRHVTVCDSGRTASKSTKIDPGHASGLELFRFFFFFKSRLFRLHFAFYVAYDRKWRILRAHFRSYAGSSPLTGQPWNSDFVRSTTPFQD